MPSWTEIIGLALVDTTIILGLEALVCYSDGSRTFAGDRSAALQSIKSLTKSRPFVFLANLDSKTLPTPVVDFETRVGEIFERFLIKEGESFDLVLNRPTPTSVQITRTSGTPTTSISPNTGSTLTWLLRTHLVQALLIILGGLLLVAGVYLLLTHVTRKFNSQTIAAQLQVDELITSQRKYDELLRMMATEQISNQKQEEIIDEQRRLLDEQKTSNQEQEEIINEQRRLIDGQKTSSQKQEEVMDEQRRLIDGQKISSQKQEEVMDEQRRLIDGQKTTIQEHLKVINERGEIIDRQKGTIDDQTATVNDLSHSLQTLESAREKSNAPTLLMHTGKGQLRETRKDLAAASERVEDPDSNVEETSAHEVVKEETEEEETKGEKSKEEDPRTAEKAAAVRDSQQQMATRSTTETSSSSSSAKSAIPSTPPAEIRPGAPSNPKLAQFMALMEHPTTPTASAQPYWVTPPPGSKRSKNTGELNFNSSNQQWSDHCWKAMKDLGYTERQARNAGVGTVWPSPERQDYGFKRPDHADKIRNSYPPFVDWKAAREEEERRKAAFTSSSAARVSPPAPPASSSVAPSSSAPVAPPSPTPSTVDKERVVHRQSKGDAMRNIRMGPMHGQRAPGAATPSAFSGRAYPAMLGHHQVQRPNPTAPPFQPRGAPQWGTEATSEGVRETEEKRR